ncbi:MAG: hypothetical protein ACTHU0_10805 [Kofleriaceae bacterium]
MIKPYKFPVLHDGEYAVVQLDPSTGKLLDADGNFANDGAHYHVFHTLVDAERFVESCQQEKPFSEWWICDASARAVSRRFGRGRQPLPPEFLRTSKLAVIAAWIRSLFRK